MQSSIAFTSVARGNVPAAVVAASVSNVLGVVLTPLLAAALLATSGGFSPATLVDIGLRLPAPLVAGQLLRPLIGGWVARHRRTLLCATIAGRLGRRRTIPSAEPVRAC